MTKTAKDLLNQYWGDDMKACESHNMRLAMEEYANLRLSEQQSKHEQELKKLYEWVLNDKKEPAQTYFSSGIVRNIAREVEFKHEQDMKEFAEQISIEGWQYLGIGIEKFWFNDELNKTATTTELLTKFKNR